MSLSPSLSINITFCPLFTGSQSQTNQASATFSSTYTESSFLCRSCWLSQRELRVSLLPFVTPPPPGRLMPCTLGVRQQMETCTGR